MLSFLIAQLDGVAFAPLLARLSPGYAVFAIVLFLGNLIIRGLRLRYLAQPSERRGRLAWIRLSAIHQALFTTLPSGVADIGFPALAARTVGCGAASATRVLLTYRIQDFWTVVILAAIGLYWRAAGITLDPVILSCGLVAAAACLIWSSDLTRLLGSVALGLVKRCRGRWSSKLEILTTPSLQLLQREMRRPAPWSQRLHGAVMTLLTWSLSAASLWSLFAMIDMPLSISDTLLVISGMNLVGAVAAFTVAGLGVGEGGLAAILMALGNGAADALATALIVRPASLASSLLCCGLVEVGYRLVRGARPARS